jgi:peptidoglycan/LPS O-acetylase OafA/YrhL
MNENKFLAFDFFRAFSALIVAFGHSRALMILPSSKFSNLSYLDKFIYFLAGFGPQAVIVFFVLSGFFITRSIVSSFNRNDFKFRDYFIARLVRLSVVAIPALVLTAILDYIGLTYFDTSLVYSNAIEVLSNVDFKGNFTPEIFIGNVFYLQTLYVPTFGSNGPLWSIAYEWWFYVLAPLVFFIFIKEFRIKKGYNIIFLIIALVVITVFIIIGNKSILLLFILWLLGSFAFWIPNKLEKYKIGYFHLLISCSAFFVCATLSRLRVIDLKMADFLIGISFTYIVIVMQFIKFNFFPKSIEFLSKISFSLYAFHFPIIALVSSILGWNNLNPNAEGTMKNLMVFLFTILVSYFLWFLFESRTNQVRVFIESVFNKKNV